MRHEAYHVTYHVMAYRPLTRTETFAAILRYRAARKVSFHDETVVISTTHGLVRAD
jgi:hypothetical protein